jgi:hypothetical protein
MLVTMTHDQVQALLEERIRYHRQIRGKIER